MKQRLYSYFIIRYMRAFQELSSSYVGDIGKVDIYHFVEADVASISADGSLKHQVSHCWSELCTLYF